VRINEAYRRLRDPIARAAYLCELRSAPVDAQRNTAMPSAFLAQQMGWREALEDAEGLAALDALDKEVRAAESDMLTQLARLFDEQPDAVRAAERVRALMFIHKLRTDLGERIDSLSN
jgi:molecular chaperone HscB